ncbi:MAG: helix-turn-helix transcriptional regulator [Firmicutes bacterium]|nr:helix-turn-helix transcriptional regulator [Bacillota bacterium]
MLVLKRDPVPAKAAPPRDLWTLLAPTAQVRVCTGDDHEEGVVPKGSLALLLPGFGHHLKRVAEDQPFGFTALQLDGPFPEPLVSILQHPPRKWQEQSFAALRSQSLKQLFGLFTQEMAHPDGLQLMTRELFLILLGAELQRLTEKEERGRFPYRLNRSTLQLVLDHMEAHLGAKNAVPDLAKLARCTPDHFIRLFREATGTTPHQYLIERRLQRAVQMLSDGERPSDVAVQLGFYDASAFTRAFKRRFDVPPSKYAQEAYARQFPKKA